MLISAEGLVSAPIIFNSLQRTVRSPSAELHKSQTLFIQHAAPAALPLSRGLLLLLLLRLRRDESTRSAEARRTDNCFDRQSN